MASKPMENYTRTIYQLIDDENYNEVIRILEVEKSSFPDSVAIQSLLGFCYWQLEDFDKAKDCYEHLVQINPNNQNYRLLYSQALYKTSQYYDAMRASSGVQDKTLKPQATILQAAIRYAENDVQSAKSILAEQNQEDLDIMMDCAVVSFKEDRIEDALEKYMDIKRIHGFIPEVAYNIALCYYRLNRFSEAVASISEIKSYTSRTHPELLRSMMGDAIEFNSATTIPYIQECYLVEAMNLMMAIEYDQKHLPEAKSALQELPTRSEEDLDQITLHNTALVTMETDPSGAFKKLSFLLSQEPPLTETFRNLLLGYCKFEYYSLAADLLAEKTDLAAQTMGAPTIDFLDALLLGSTSKEEAYRKFDELCKAKSDILRKIKRNIEDAQKTHDEEQQKRESLEYEAVVGELIPILMCQAKIFWDMGKFEFVELLLMKYQEFCFNDRTWKLNLAHTLFMQEKMTDAIQWYEPLVLGETSLLDVEAIVVANLCVAYVVTNQNSLADSLINRVTDEEEQKVKDETNPDQAGKLVHLSIIHLVIGTLYCAHSNFEFGIDYIFKAFNPMHQKLNADTWFYAKKCLLEVIRALVLHLYEMPDTTFDHIMTFLDEADKEGKKIQSINDLTVAAEEAREHQTISFEARTIKATFLALYHF